MVYDLYLTEQLRFPVLIKRTIIINTFYMYNGHTNLIDTNGCDPSLYFCCHFAKLILNFFTTDLYMNKRNILKRGNNSFRSIMNAKDPIIY